ncbi:integrase [Streptomyces chumphonensis]|uniref:Integrase n=2 Tax=Streptomyces chumphonensis TaxID=1214925 RepID=A0A927EZ32_9ACTN|nr:integrase [Streptomyces chumphonensis]MBD3932276.1 integrase [Streptomyces chumphonensis]
MADFFTDEGTPWARRLWDIGSVLALEELWEAGYWQTHGVLSQAACDWQRRELSSLIGPDRGLGDRDLRKELTGLLKCPLPDPSPARRRFKEIIGHVRAGYLERWTAAVNAPGEPQVKPERFSRMVASHLLDLGYSASFLKAWAKDLHQTRATTTDISDSAAELARTRARQFDVLVALEKAPRRELAEPLEGWYDKGKIVAWLREHGYNTSGIRAGGGFVYRFTALDVYSAAEQARQMVERMTARSQFLRRDRGGVEPLPYIWVAGHRRPIPLAPPARGADVLTLVNEGHLYQVGSERSRIDEALELAAVVNRGPLAPAVAGAWAAVESLLSQRDDPTDSERSGKAVAADRMAAIITCSWPRAELTALAHRHKPRAGDDLSWAIAACAKNQERARLVAEALHERGASALDFTGASTKYTDQPAAQRMTDLVRGPRPVLSDVRGAFRVALRRLYRTRNIILHGGATQGVALEASLRTAAPLVGAGLDRIVHAAYAEELAPLDLAARAEVALQLVRGETGLSVVDLLEPV